MADSSARAARGPLLGLSGYQWLVIGAGWAGWGFDVFDALLFNFVSPNCIPVLLHLARGSSEAREAVVFWTGALTSLLLIGWAVGGLLFGWLADRLGRKRALFVTILAYALGTALCALSANIWQLVCFRLTASLGIGGEWAIGATLIAESVPESRRVEGRSLFARNRRTTRALRWSSPPGWPASSCTPPRRWGSLWRAY
jgi:MFS family permease